MARIERRSAHNVYLYLTREDLESVLFTQAHMLAPDNIPEDARWVLKNDEGNA